MSWRPFKRTGFKQDLYSISSTKLEDLGTFRIDKYGRKFRYARAGATALSAGKLGLAADVATAHFNQTAAAYAVGSHNLTLTVTAGTAILENELVGGQLQINDAAGEGHAYIIESNTAIDASGTEINISIEDGIRVALTTDSQFTLVHSPWNDVVESTTVYPPVGIPLLAVTATYYYWAQTGGLGICLTYETSGTGYCLEQSQDLSGAVNTVDSDATEARIGYMHGRAGVSTEYKPIILTLD